MTVTTLEPVTIEHLDFQPACEMADCDSPATHLMVSPHKTCYRDCLLCILCVERLRTAWSNLSTDPACPRCHVRMPHDQPVFRFEPLP